MRMLMVLFISTYLLFLTLGCEAEPTEKELAIIVAEEWIEENATTFTERGGDELEVIKVVEIEGEIYQIKFEYESAFAGYGKPDEDEVDAQVITPHTIAVTVENEKVTEVVTDGKYNEIEKVLMAVIIDGKVITEEEVEMYMKMIIRDRAEEDLSDEEVREKAIEKATEAVFFNEYLDEKRITISEEEVEEELLLRVKNHSEVETKEEYFEIMATQGVSREEIERDINQTIKTDKLFDLLKKDVEISEEDVLQEYEHHRETSGVILSFEVAKDMIKRRLTRTTIEEMIADELAGRKKNAEIKILE